MWRDFVNEVSAMDENKHPNQSQSSKENQKGTKAPENRQSTVVRSRRIFAKRWMYPALYLGAAALIIGLMYIKSQSGASPTAGNAIDDGSGTSPTAAQAETFQWPVAAGVKAKVALGYFPDKGTTQQQAAALVSYSGGFYAHQGYDIKSSDGKPFSVTAAVSGKVTDVTKNPMYGNTVEVTGNGYVVRYESLGDDVKVTKGNSVTQGQVLGSSGTCQFEQAQGNHLYFEIDKNGKPVDPATLLPKQQ
jgi:stage II sporulation protein Q